MKKSFKPGAMLSPLPAVMVSCGRENEKPNIITIAWTGIVNSEPPMTYVSIRKSRHSHGIISETGEFVINLTTEELAFATDWCGVKSGRDVNKFVEMKLTPEESEKVSCPGIAESPVCLECVVREIHEYPSHDMFVAEIVNVRVNQEIIDENNKICLERAGLLCYNHGEYYKQGSRRLGTFGYSVMKPSTRKRKEKEQAQRRQANRATSRKKRAANMKKRAADKSNK